ncbi:hypothetical protein J7E70_25205 [Variovorax paradoxus]|nr:hypothetical protein [Variovorax paradoxus]MBT2303747.1 hypothetical protein [Variovorax paradoxus]
MSFATNSESSAFGSAQDDPQTQVSLLALVEMKEPGVLAGKHYKATIEARIAKFRTSAEMRKIKLVVGQIRFDSPSQVA